MVQFRKPVERSEDIIDLRGLTPEQARVVVAAHDKARQMGYKSVSSSKAILRQQQEEFRRQQEKELRAAVLRKLHVRRG